MESLSNLSVMQSVSVTGVTFRPELSHQTAKETVRQFTVLAHAELFKTLNINDLKSYWERFSNLARMLHLKPAQR